MATHNDSDPLEGTTRRAIEQHLTEIKRRAREALEVVANDRNLTSIQDDFGYNTAIGRIRWLFHALPDARLSVDWQVAEGDWVVTGATLRGTHLGEWEGLPPTGKPVTLRAVFRDQIVDGKIVHHEALYDMFSALQQVGARFSLGTSE